MEDIVLKESPKTAAKKVISIVLIVALSIVCVLLVLLSAFVSSLAFSKTPENTAQLFGYKIFYCENDLSETDIKGGSLVIVKNSDDDEFYTPQALSQNAALVIPEAGKLIIENGLWIVISFMVPPIFLFLILLLAELKKLLVSYNEKEMQTELEIIENREIEEIYEREINL